MDFQSLRLLLKYGMQYGHESIRKSGLTDTEHMLCSFIYFHTGCSQDDVIRATRMDKTTVAKALKSLEEKGFVIRRTSDTDKRKKQPVVTAAGVDSISETIDIYNEWMDSVSSCLSDKEQQEFSEYCSRLLARAQEISMKN